MAIDSFLAWGCQLLLHIISSCVLCTMCYILHIEMPKILGCFTTPKHPLVYSLELKTPLAGLGNLLYQWGDNLCSTMNPKYHVWEQLQTTNNDSNIFLTSTLSPMASWPLWSNSTLYNPEWKVGHFGPTAHFTVLNGKFATLVQQHTLQSWMESWPLWSNSTLYSPEWQVGHFGPTATFTILNSKLSNNLYENINFQADSDA